MTKIIDIVLKNGLTISTQTIVFINEQFLFMVASEASYDVINFCLSVDHIYDNQNAWLVNSPKKASLWCS